MFDQSLLKRSGQLWKLVLGGSSIGVGALLVLLCVSGFQSADYTRGLATLFSGFALFFASFAAVIFFVRCPRCHVKLVWRAIAEGNALNVAGSLLTMVRCPRCSYPDGG